MAGWVFEHSLAVTGCGNVSYNSVFVIKSIKRVFVPLYAFLFLMLAL